MKKQLKDMNWDEQVSWFVWEIIESIVGGQNKLRSTVFFAMNCLYLTWREQWEKENKTKIL